MHVLLKAFFVYCLLSSFPSWAQVRIQIKLDTRNLSSDSNYYLAGNVNGWNPKDTLYLFNRNYFELTAKPGDIIEFKITRGTWTTVESDSNGSDISNRIINAIKDTAIVLSIEGWKDDFKTVAKKHTASPNVFLLDSAFYIPQLDRFRPVRIYLPPDYYTTSKRFPVLYMNDGQNCFDEYTAGFGEWHVDETLDHFYDSCKKSIIVVAVDHGGSHRLQEYDPYDFENFGKAEGKAYSSFLVETLKPYIDSIYRTRSSKKYTHIAGSSMGAVISMWSVIAYPEVFGNAGIFSPAFWTARPIYGATEKNLLALKDHSFFLYAGGRESKIMVADTKAMYRILTEIKMLRAQMFIDELATHNEAAWSKWFPVYLKWILK